VAPLSPHASGIDPGLLLHLGAAGVALSAGAWAWRCWWPHQHALLTAPRPKGGPARPRVALPWQRDPLDPAVYGISPYRPVLGHRHSRIHGHRVVQARWRTGTLIFSPPRWGKTAGPVIETVMHHEGPVVVTSTRRDVLDKCLRKRARNGTVWVADFTPDGLGELPANCRRLDWAPELECERWDTAMRRADALTVGLASGATDADFWRSAGADLLAALLHAAALNGRPTSTWVRWVSDAKLTEPRAILVQAGADRAVDNLDTYLGAHEGTKRSIRTTLSACIRPFHSDQVLYSADRARAGGFDPDTFLSSQDTLFIVAPADDGASVAPLVVGLVEQIRAAAVRISNREGELPLPLLLALDEVANIAPLPQLGAILSEGGGRNIITVLVVQDMSTVDRRWGPGFSRTLLQLCGSVVVLPGVKDPETLRALSDVAGTHEVTRDERGSNIERRWYLISRIWPHWPATRVTYNERAKTSIEPRFSQDAIRTLPRGIALALIDNQVAHTIRVRDFDTVRPFSRWAKLPLPAASAPVPATCPATVPRGEPSPAFAVQPGGLDPEVWGLGADRPDQGAA
jgi:type IV secretion system protein VirD4